MWDKFITAYVPWSKHGILCAMAPFYGGTYEMVIWDFSVYVFLCSHRKDSQYGMDNYLRGTTEKRCHGKMANSIPCFDHGTYAVFLHTYVSIYIYVNPYEMD